MSTVDFGTMDPKASLKQVIEELANLMDNLNFLMNGNIDFKNVRASSITADRLKVTELSAISANLGKVIAGILIGAYISTADSTFPRVDLSSVDSLFTAYNDADHYIGMNPDYFGNPVFFFRDPDSDVNVGIFAGAFVIDALAGDVDIRSQAGDLYLTADTGSGKFIKVASWSALYNITTSKTLQQSLNEKAISGNSTSSVAVSDGHNHGFTTLDYIQCYDNTGAPTVKKQWVPYGGSSAHSHTM